MVFYQQLDCSLAASMLRYCNTCILYGILTTSVRDHVPNDYDMLVLVDAWGSGFCAEGGFHSQTCVWGCFAHQAHSHDFAHDAIPPKRVNASVALFQLVAWKVIRLHDQSAQSCAIAKHHS